MKWIQLLFIVVNAGALFLFFHDFNAVNEQIRMSSDILKEEMTLTRFIEISPHTTILKTTLTAWFLFTLVHIIVSNQNKNKQRNNNANS
ncbi:Protein of unknown function [Bacillus mycoides]|nr:Protein of unknown function [Bacillus mycoides]